MGKVETQQEEEKTTPKTTETKSKTTDTGKIAEDEEEK